MKLEDLIKLVQTDPIEALKEAFDMGSTWNQSSADEEYSREQFMAFMDGAKSGMNLRVATIDASKLTKEDIEKYLKLIEKLKVNPTTAPCHTFDPNKPWWLDGPTCHVRSTSTNLSPEDSLQQS